MSDLEAPIYIEPICLEQRIQMDDQGKPVNPRVSYWRPDGILEGISHEHGQTHPVRPCCGINHHHQVCLGNDAHLFRPTLMGHF